jgi:RNA polymerase sigma-70 factor (ECF subfamily)
LEHLELRHLSAARTFLRGSAKKGCSERAFDETRLVSMAATDAELIVASLEDPEPFATVFDRHYPAIAGFFRRRLDPSLADELAAETFLCAFKARHRYDTNRADARPWLFGIAAKLLSGHRRSEERRLRAMSRAERRFELTGDADALAGRIDAIADAPILAGALASLSRGDREVLLLYAWADLSYEQIADALQIPVGTVRSRLHRARTAVRERLEREPLQPLRISRIEEGAYEQRA